MINKFKKTKIIFSTYSQMDPIKKGSVGSQALFVIITCNWKLDIQQVVFMSYTP